MMKDILSHIREQVISLHQHTTKTQQEIADDLGISQNAVSGIIRRFIATGSSATNRAGRCGRKRKFDKRSASRLARISKKFPRMTARQVNNESGNLAGEVSLRTVQRTLVSMGRFARRPIRAPLLTLSKRVTRCHWACDYRHYGMEFWEKVWFSCIVSVVVFLCFCG